MKFCMSRAAHRFDTHDALGQQGCVRFQIFLERKLGVGGTDDQDFMRLRQGRGHVPEEDRRWMAVAAARRTRFVMDVSESFIGGMHDADLLEMVACYRIKAGNLMVDPCDQMKNIV